MQLPNHKYMATDGFEDNRRVTIKYGNDNIGWEHLLMFEVVNRKKIHDDGQKIVVEGTSSAGDPVREITNLEARGRDTKVIVAVD